MVPLPYNNRGTSAKMTEKVKIMTVFVDGITLTRRFPSGSIKTMTGLRHLPFLQPGDIDKTGAVVTEDIVFPERLYTAWIKGSHDSKIQIASDGTTLSMKGNPGRFGRPDNLFNLEFDDTIKACNKIAASQGFPLNSFAPGVRDPYTRSQLDTIWAARAAEGKEPDQCPELPWTGARIWSIHMTQNYVTGSAENAQAFMDWANTQTMARVKKARLGPSTLVWGSLSYCQVELYDKAKEMLAHAKGPEAKKAMLESPAYQHAFVNGIIRLEVKCAKDFLKHRKLTFLGNWDMGTVTQLFNEKSEIMRRGSALVAVEDEDILALLPSRTRVHAAAWMAGIDVRKHMSERTFFRHAAVLRPYGIDICEKRNITVVRPKMREVAVQVAEVPTWYSLSAA